MKIWRKIITLILSVVLGSYILLYSFLSLPFCQQLLTHAVEKSLAERLHTRVHIGSVELGLFNRVMLRDVVIYDQKYVKMLTGNVMSARIALRPLLEGKVFLRTISLIDLSVRLYREGTDKAPNYQFLVDAFSSKSPKKESSIDLGVNSLIIRRAALRYDVEGRPATIGRLNLNHLYVKDLDVNLSLKALRRDTLSLRVRKLAFQEQSGLRVDHLSLNLQANRQSCRISGLQVELPHSRFSKESIRLAYKWTSAGPTDVNVRTTVSRCAIMTDDVAPLFPALAGWHEMLYVESDLTVRPTLVSVGRCRVYNPDRTLDVAFSATLSRKERNKLLQLRELEVKCLPKIYLKAWQKWNASPPPAATALAGPIVLRCEGNLIQRGKDWSALADFELSSAYGHVRGQRLEWRDHQLSTQQGIMLQADLSRLPGNHQLGRIDLTAKGRCRFSKGRIENVWAAINLPCLEWRGYSYRDLSLQAQCRLPEVRFEVSSSDANLKFSAQGDARWRNGLQQLRAALDVDCIVPQRLRWGGETDDSYAAQVRLSAQDLRLAHPVAEVDVRHFRQQSAGEVYQVDSMRLMTEHRLGINYLRFESDFLRFACEGNFAYNRLGEHIPLFVRQQLMPLLRWKQKITPQAADHWAKFDLRLRNADFFRRVLHIPLSTSGEMEVNGFVDNPNRRFLLTGSVDSLRYSSSRWGNVSIFCRCEGQQMNALAQTTKMNARGKIRMAAEMAVKPEQALTTLTIDEGRILRGSLSATADLQRYLQSGVLETRIRPSRFYIRDTAWTVSPSRIVLEHGRLSFSDFGVGNGQQSVAVSGVLSSHPADSLNVDLHQIDLAYVLNLVNFHAVDFAGAVSGRACLSQSLSAPLLKYDLDVANFTFNDASMGRLKVRGKWDAREGKIGIHARARASAESHLDINGYVSPKEKNLDLRFNAHHTTVQFLQRYTEGIFSEIDGTTSGHLRLFGPLKALDFSGVHQVALDARVLSTGCRYNMRSDSVVFSPGSIRFGQVALTDAFGQHATATGELRHEHLKRLHFDVSADFRNMLVYDCPRTPDLPFYATIHGTGRMHLSGHPGTFAADIFVRPERHSELTYVVDAPSVSPDRQLLTIGTAGDVAKLQPDANPAKAESGGRTDIYLNLNVEATPDAAVRLIMDEKSGDYILVHGSGDLQATYYNKGRLNMFGTYTVADGIYKMSLQDIIRKDFTFAPGGTVRFNGNPMESNLDLKAIYTVNSASLADLSPTGNFSNNRIKVDCILNLKGVASSPQVSFDLDLPTVSEDEKQMVHRLINTEEGMNMQIIYLLGIGRFYTYDYAASAASSSNQSQSSVAIKSFLSNTLSSHLNDILSNAIGMKNWTFGTNLSTGDVGWSDMEVEGLLSGRLLNNRLLINGNFGYRDRVNTSTNFIGDFDIQWLLTPSGSIRLKAYSETNDRYFTKSTLTTQGTGVLLKRDFDNLRELFRIHRRKRVRRTPSVAPSDTSRVHVRP